MLDREMHRNIEMIGFAELAEIRANPPSRLDWSMPFMLPGWIEAWWREFGSDYQPLILVSRQGEHVEAVIPLKRRSDQASFIGDVSVCDYADVITTPALRPQILTDLSEYLSRAGINELVLETLRPDSALYGLCRALDDQAVNISVSDVTYELKLEKDWDGYLRGLDGSQRRDIERKERRLERLGTPVFKVLADQEIKLADLEIFYQMMIQSRHDKAGFLSDAMKRFFAGIVSALSAEGLARLGFLEIGKLKVAGVLFFETTDTVYLYNSGYDPDFADVSVGLVSKLYALRYAIASGKRLFDFLKGAEPYKARLGASRIDLFACRWMLDR